MIYKSRATMGDVSVTTDTDLPSGESPDRSESPRRRPVWVLAVPLVLVNLVAVWGQWGWAYGQLPPDSFPLVAKFALAGIFALAVESIGIYLAMEEHLATMSGQASLPLRLASRGSGLLIGYLNFSHFGHIGPEAAISFGCLSASSPWLWGVYSKARNRFRLAEMGLADTRGVKLSTARKIWHPVRSAQVMSYAAWAGITDPAEAVTAWEIRDIPISPTTAGRSKEEWWRMAQEIKADHPRMKQDDIAKMLGVSARWLRECRNAVEGGRR